VILYPRAGGVDRDQLTAALRRARGCLLLLASALAASPLRSAGRAGPSLPPVPASARTSTVVAPRGSGGGGGGAQKEKFRLFALRRNGGAPRLGAPRVAEEGARMNAEGAADDDMAPRRAGGRDRSSIGGLGEGGRELNATRRRRRAPAVEVVAE
jgi:hypothetical protein